jgi:hypothetical protein
MTGIEAWAISEICGLIRTQDLGHKRKHRSIHYELSTRGIEAQVISEICGMITT